MTTATIDKTAKVAAKAPKVEAAPVAAAPVEVTAPTKSVEPVATGLLSGTDGEFYYFPSLDVYAPMIGGKAGDFQLTPDMWERMKQAFMPVENVKAQIANAAKAAAKATVYTYTVTCAITFESTEVLDPATDLTWDTIANLAKVHGFEDKLKTPFKLHPGKKAGGGGTRSPQGDGTASGYYAAENLEQVKPLSEKQKAILAYALDNNYEVPLELYGKFGYGERKLMINERIGFEKKGYRGGVTAAGAFRFYPERLKFDLRQALELTK